MKKYKVVAVSITNNKRDLFFLQKKDNSYWIPELRLKYCFFGGKIEEGENPYSALKRELSEELDSNIAEIVYKKSKEVFSDNFTDILNRNCYFSLYESILSNRMLKKIASFPVKEGEAGMLVKRKDIPNLQFFPDLKILLEKYFSYIKNS